MRPLPQKYSTLLKSYAKTLKIPARKSLHSIAIGPFGPCCVGKTTTMKYLARKLPFVHINHDLLRLFMRKKKITDINNILYKHLFIIRLAQQYLQQNYSVILDRDFGTNNTNILKDAQSETKKLGVKFFLIQIKAPQWFIIKKIATRKLIPSQKGGIQDRKTAMNCYQYSLKNYNTNYKHLKKRAIATIDTSKSIPNQLSNTIKSLKKVMGI